MVADLIRMFFSRLTGRDGLPRSYGPLRPDVRFGFGLHAYRPGALSQRVGQVEAGPTGASRRPLLGAPLAVRFGDGVDSTGDALRAAPSATVCSTKSRNPLDSDHPHNHGDGASSGAPLSEPPQV